MNDVLRIAHLRISHQGAILRWAILTFTTLHVWSSLLIKCLNCQVVFVFVFVIVCCLFVGQDMSPHHSDQMSGRSEDNYIGFFYMSICKVLSQWVSESVTRSPIELFWTAKKINHNFHIRMYLCRIYLSIIESIITSLEAHRWKAWRCDGSANIFSLQNGAGEILLKCSKKKSI